MIRPPDARSGWSTAPVAARLAGDGEAFRFFETSEDAITFLRRLGQTAAKQRTYRRRQSRGVVVVPVQVEPAIIEALLDAGRLDDARSHDRSQIGLEFAAILRHWAKAWRGIRYQ